MPDNKALPDLWEDARDTGTGIRLQYNPRTQKYRVKPGTEFPKPSGGQFDLDKPQAPPAVLPPDVDPRTKYGRGGPPAFAPPKPDTGTREGPPTPGATATGGVPGATPGDYAPAGDPDRYDEPDYETPTVPGGGRGSGPNGEWTLADATKTYLDAQEANRNSLDPIETTKRWQTELNTLLASRPDVPQNLLTAPTTFDKDGVSLDGMWMQRGAFVSRTEAGVKALLDAEKNLTNWFNTARQGMSDLYGMQTSEREFAWKQLTDARDFVQRIIDRAQDTEERKDTQRRGFEQRDKEQEAAAEAARLTNEFIYGTAQDLGTFGEGIFKDLFGNIKGTMSASKALEAAISAGNLKESIRHNKELERLDVLRVGIEEKRAKYELLSTLLANGGVGMFALALFSPDAAAKMFQEATGSAPNLGEGPFAYAQKLRGQMGQGGLTTPSMQGLASMNPLEAQYLNAAYQGTGGNLQQAVLNLTPETPGAVARSR